jgi:hypothetical protein
MADEDRKEQNLEEWLEDERTRLDKGFSFEPPPKSAEGKPGAAEEALAGLGLGAGVVGGAVAPHPNPVTFEGCEAAVITNALRSEIPDDDTRVEVGRTGDSVVVTILQSQKSKPYEFSPAVSVTLLEKTDALTVAVSDLSQRSARDAISSMGSTVLDQGKQVLSRGKSSGAAGLLDAAKDVMESVGDLVEDIQDLGLPRKVWGVIDRVGGAAEQAYLDEKRKEQELQRQREAAERAWTHCESCGRAYRADEENRADCPSCGAPRGPKPGWLE